MFVLNRREELIVPSWPAESISTGIVVSWRCHPMNVAVLAKSVPAPMAVLKLPILLLLIEKQPVAVLYVPLVRLRSAFCPCAVLPPT